jgi:hypothetical protein
MTHWYFLLAAAVVLAVLSLFRFRGCGFSARTVDDYGTAVRADNPVAWFRLQEAADDKTGVAKNEAGSPDGVYGTAPSPLNAGVPNWHSTAVPVTSLDLGIKDPRLVLQEDVDPFDFSIRVHGAFVQVPANAATLQNLTEFTLEMFVLPDWDIDAALGKYYCVLELAGLAPASPLKSAGFGLYAGPANTQDLNTPYSWQAWMGIGNGFRRLEEMPYVQVPGNPNPNPGPTVQKTEPTYLAFTFSKSQGQAILYLFYESRDLDYVAYGLNPVAYVPVIAGTVSQGLHIGITAQGPLFPPPPPGIEIPLLYPFSGQIGNVAIYNKVLTEDTLRHHATEAFFVD